MKETRLRALRDAPYAFGSTYAREDTFTDGEWQRRAAQGNWFLAWSAGGPVGIAAMVSEDQAPQERHLVAMWVEPGQRGRGVACDLVEAVCDQARSAGADAVSLWVADGNPRARRFYDQCGFCPCDVRQPLPSAPEVWEERMRRPLTRPS